MSEKQVFLFICIVGLVLFVILKLFYVEGFDVLPDLTNTTSPSDVPIPSDTPIPSGCPVVSSTIAPNWWDVEPPKQIVSYITGVRFPVHSIQPAKAINSSFQVPYIKAGEVDASGCIVVLNDGTYTTRMCNIDSAEQRWKIVRVTNPDVFNQLLQSGLSYYSGNHVTTILPQGIDYGFFMIISEKDPSMVLASNGGNLSVQRIGNFTSQFWDITKDLGTASIAIYGNNTGSSFGSNYSSGVSANAGQQYQYPGLSQGATVPSSNPSSPGTQPFNINLNLDKDSLLSIFGSIDTAGPGLFPSSTSSVDRFGNVQSKCKPCPSILTDYIAKNEIPCNGCKL